MLSLTKPLDGPLDLAAPDVAPWAFLGTILSLDPLDSQVWEALE